MDFDHSTQARSWLFDEATLNECRQKLVADRPKANVTSSAARVRKFASGFQRRQTARLDSEPDSDHSDTRSCSQTSDSSSYTGEDINLPAQVTESTLSVQEQEILVRFHAHQLSTLVGPYAVFKGLMRSSSVLATAIIFFRRFYLSNSVLDFEPRRIAVAAAFLAAKVEDCRVELDLLERATAFIEQRVVTTALGRQESYFICAKDIEAGERELLEGLNYELRCYHPHDAIRVLAKDVITFLLEARKSKARQFKAEDRNPSETFQSEMASPRRVSDFSDEGRDAILRERAVAVALNALLSSDVPFLFTPGQIAFAAVAIALRKRGSTMPIQQDGNYCPLNPKMKAFLRSRFPSKHEYDLHDFESQVCKVVHQVDRSPSMDFKALVISQIQGQRDFDDLAVHIYEIERVSAKVSSLRVLTNAVRVHCEVEGVISNRKRKDASDDIVTTADCAFSKIPKVTPTKL